MQMFAAMLGIKRINSLPNGGATTLGMNEPGEREYRTKPTTDTIPEGSEIAFLPHVLRS